MTLPRSAGEVLADHVLFEVESVDRMLLNVYVPTLQHRRALVGDYADLVAEPLPASASTGRVPVTFSFQFSTVWTIQ